MNTLAKLQEQHGKHDHGAVKKAFRPIRTQVSARNTSDKDINAWSSECDEFFKAYKAPVAARIKVS